MTAIINPEVVTDEDHRRRIPLWAWVLVGISVVSIVRWLTNLLTDSIGSGRANDLTSSGTIAAALGAAAPIGLAALGGLFAERVGVVNIGLEGMMVLGTWGAGYGGYHAGVAGAFIGGMAMGALGGLLHALATVTFGVDHVVSGFAINILAPGVTRFLASELFAGRGDGTITQSPRMDESVARFDLPLLSGGDLFGWKSPDPLGWFERKHIMLISDVAGILKGLTTDMALPTLVAVALFPISWYVLWRTPFGLRLRSIGEKPSAADSLGVDVVKMKYIGVTISGALAGLGGAWLVLDTKAYAAGQTANRGFQGLAALIFGNWRPGGIAAGAALFAYGRALTQRLNTEPVRALFLLVAIALLGFALLSMYRRKLRSSGILAAMAFLMLMIYLQIDEVNNQIVYMTPFIVTLVVLTFSSQRLRPPAASGKVWRKGME